MPENEQPKKTPYEMFASLCPAAPSQDQMEAWKAQAPNQNVSLWAAPDNKRFFLLRGVTGVELKQLQGMIPSNATPDTADLELTLLLVERACVWTSTTQDGKLTTTQLRASTAGLPATLRQVIEVLSDFIPPAQLFDSVIYM